MKKQSLKSKLETYILNGWSNRFWYELSNRNAGEFCKRNGLNVSTFLAYLSILSPRIQMNRSIRLTKQYALTGNVNGIMQQRVTALRTFDLTGHISGTKIQAFHNSLRLYKDAVCIDIHMSRIFGFNDGQLMIDSQRWNKNRLHYKNKIRKLATEHGCKSYQMQAVLWCGYLSTITNDQSRFNPMEF